MSDLTDRFTKNLENGMKELTSNGLHTSSPLWKFAKMNLMTKLAKDEGVSLDFNYRGWRRAILISKLPIIGNNKILTFLNKICKLKDYIFRYTTVYGHKFFIRPAPKMADILNDYKILDIWEENTTKIVEDNVKKGDVCVDVGASQGYFAMLFARHAGPTGTIVAIEPTDFQQPYLKKNFKKNGYKNITQVHCGAWDKDETKRMPLNAPPYCQFKLRCRPVDDILEELGIWQVDFIKVDVDGPEPKVLRGLERTFQRSPNLKMVIELYPKYIENAGCSVEEFNEVINKYFDYTIIPDDYEDGCWNLFCIRKCKKE